MRAEPKRGTVPVVFRAPPQLKRRVRAAAELDGRTVSEFTRIAVDEAATRRLRVATGGADEK